jgi:DNA-binding transcriptional LysR family regulator
VGLVLTPRIEVETLVMALRLVAKGLGDTYLPGAHTGAWHFPPGLSTTSFDPPLFDTLALVTRKGAQLSPAMRLWVTHVEAHIANVADQLQASQRPGHNRSPRSEGANPHRIREAGIRRAR